MGSSPVFMLRCKLTTRGFLSWRRGELREIEVGRTPPQGRKGKQVAKPVYTTQEIPAPYDHIVSQLLCEEAHGEADHGHEARRRQTYAQRVLDAFWKEIKEYDDEPEMFRSKVLTPILQRQLWGVQENYSPMVRAGVRNGEGNPTIKDATKFYLKDDPTDPEWIPSYRRNLLHIPEARWHLGLIMGVSKLGCPEAYNTVRHNQDLLDAKVDDSNVDNERVPLLKVLDLQVIISEHLETFFHQEMDLVVCTLCYIPSVPTGLTVNKAAQARKAYRSPVGKER